MKKIKPYRKPPVVSAEMREAQEFAIRRIQRQHRERLQRTGPPKWLVNLWPLGPGISGLLGQCAQADGLVE